MIIFLFIIAIRFLATADTETLVTSELHIMHVHQALVSSSGTIRMSLRF